VAREAPSANALRRLRVKMPARTSGIHVWGDRRGQRGRESATALTAKRLR
jgi:hypothetical protein